MIDYFDHSELRRGLIESNERNIEEIIVRTRNVFIQDKQKQLYDEFILTNEKFMKTINDYVNAFKEYMRYVFKEYLIRVPYTN